MGISLTHCMDLNWFVDSVPGFACLAIGNGMAECKNYASIHLDICASLHIDISPFYSIEMQKPAAGIPSLPWDNCYESLFFF